MHKIKTIFTVVLLGSFLVGCETPNQRYTEPSANADPVLAHNLKKERDKPLLAYFDCLRAETDKYANQKNSLPQDIAKAATYTCDSFAQRYGAVMKSQARLYRTDPNIGHAIYTDLQSQGYSFFVKRVLESRL